ncbi:MAG: glycogen synthase GlgA [Nitrospiraceae bacterium]|nr:glycogen synthase GlgA [Nitrospiraceae bacterium]
MRILIATPEAVPYVKTGGLGDVTGALLSEFRKHNIDASLIMPLYRTIRDAFTLYRTGTSILIRMGGASFRAEIWTSDGSSSPEAYFVECEEFFGRPELYGTPAGDYPDNAPRFSFFSRAVLEACIAMEIKPDVIHCNDWQTGLLPLYLKDHYRDFFRKTATLFTIHNIGYQGIFPPAALWAAGIGRNYFHPEAIEFYGKINFMKAGLLYADLINTVSATYAKEILGKEFGFGLEGVLRRRKADLCGVMNGIDYDEWDPAHDAAIPARYGADDLKGKAACRKALLKETGLTRPNSPLFGVVSRFSSQKGIDLIADAADELVGLGISLVILGKGEAYYQNLLTEVAGRNEGRVFAKIGFEEELARLIYAGCDFFLMPSSYEPCGLGQLIALKYGTIPVARRTGGLADSIRDYDHLASRGTGFLFDDFTPSAMRDAVKRALCIFTEKGRRARVVLEGMREDFSWRKPAGEYFELYEKACGKVSG